MKVNYKFFLIAICIIGVGIIIQSQEIANQYGDGRVKVDTRIEKKTANGLDTYDFKADSSLTVHYTSQNGASKPVTYSQLESFQLKNGENVAPYLVFNERGKIVEAKFKTGKEGDYILGNEIVKLKKGSIVSFKDGKAEIKIPGDKIEPPSVINSKEKGETSFMYDSLDGQGIFLGAYKIKGGVGFENGNYFIQNQEQLELGDIVIANPNHIKTFIDFKGIINGGYKGAYISMDRERGVLVLGANIEQAGPAVKINPENAYGYYFDSPNTDHMAFKVLGNKDGSYVMIRKSAPLGKNQEFKIVPEIEHLNQFIMDQDYKSVYYNSKNEKMYLRPNGNLIKEFPASADSTTVATTISGSFKTKNSRIERVMEDMKVGVGNYNEIVFGKNKRFMRVKAYKDYPRLYTGVSDLEIYNYELTEAGFEKLTKVNVVAADSSGTAYLSKQSNIRYLFDLMNSIPTQQARMLKRLKLYDQVSGAYARAYSDGTVQMTVGRGYMDGDTWRHEMAHQVDFNGGSGRFNSMWYGSGIDRNVKTSSYSYNGGETVSEWLAYTGLTSDKQIKNMLGENWQNNKWYRAAFAVGWHNYLYTHERIAEIFGRAGLKYDKESLYRYMSDVGINIK